MVGGNRGNLLWIRDCWSFFVSNLPPNVTTNELYELFHDAGSVFDVFVPQLQLYDRIPVKGRLNHGFNKF